mmetsp:Transcript_80019/g.132223  ORF Transcript_80019/g.132223 Transcript_80019/m.132223 type:complete len:91 (-) Transcript_80019:37-309(-)
MYMIHSVLEFPSIYMHILTTHSLPPIGLHTDVWQSSHELQLSPTSSMPAPSRELCRMGKWQNDAAIVLCTEHGIDGHTSKRPNLPHCRPQ